MNGIAIICACRSANRNVKNGNSVISCPGGSGGIMRLLFQKSNSPNGCPSSTFFTLCPTCIAPSRFPSTTTNATPTSPSTTGVHRGAPPRMPTASSSLRPADRTRLYTMLYTPPTVSAKNVGTARLNATTGSIPVALINTAVRNCPQ